MESNLSQLEDSYDIIISGFGPVGQLCSNLLNKYGLSIGAIESNFDIYSEPRAISIDDEIQRIISSLGLWDSFKDRVNVPDFADLVFPNGKVVLRGPVTSTSNGFPFVSTFDQPELESLLRTNINKSKNINIFLGYEIINFKEEGELIDISIKNLKDNKLLKIKTKYLFACDGSESFIRSKLKIDLIDLKYNKEWIIVDISLQDSYELEKVARYICDPERPTIFTTLTGNRIRLEFQLLAGENGKEIVNENKYIRFLPLLLRDKEYQIERAYIHKYKGNCAKELRRKNIFLLGDAAHQMPPFAGQGLSSGLRDASNLCWKLAHVINNQFNDEILDTYQIERMDEVKNSIDSSIALGKLIDSLSLAFKNNSPLEEAIPPEAREQAYGKKSLTAQSISRGLFSNLVKDNNVGKPVPMARFSKKVNNASIDELLDSKFSVISGKDPRGLLDERALSSFKAINAVFINISNYNFLNSRLAELIDVGDIIVRPDKLIYGITSSEVTLQNLADEFFNRIGK
tara:strand:+ start:202 stop:1746 length:1545 start_codon:yes stop_codon:yes gene_type:complete